MMYNNIKRCFCAVIVALGMLTGPLAITSQSLAQTLKLIYVDDSVATSGSGASWNSPRKHLQDALADASEKHGTVSTLQSLERSSSSYFIDDDRAPSI